ncbi:unnamed protein product [Bemisia tabaci]|uniref:Uncharacterized protein n=1 Tax=Bemisia tabaci TaxID=7038 RepID=A0A9P0AEU5_BEMTA|nr:unnamed protein product [Bemisia tabaci]
MDYFRNFKNLNIFLIIVLCTIDVVKGPIVLKSKPSRIVAIDRHSKLKVINHPFRGPSLKDVKEGKASKKSLFKTFSCSRSTYSECNDRCELRNRHLRGNCDEGACICVKNRGRKSWRPPAGRNGLEYKTNCSIKKNATNCSKHCLSLKRGLKGECEGNTCECVEWVDEEDDEDEESSSEDDEESPTPRALKSSSGRGRGLMRSQSSSGRKSPSAKRAKTPARSKGSQTPKRTSTSRGGRPSSSKGRRTPSRSGKSPAAGRGAKNGNRPYSKGGKTPSRNGGKTPSRSNTPKRPSSAKKPYSRKGGRNEEDGLGFGVPAGNQGGRDDFPEDDFPGGGFDAPAGNRNGRKEDDDDDTDGPETLKNQRVPPPGPTDRFGLPPKGRGQDDDFGDDDFPPNGGLPPKQQFAPPGGVPPKQQFDDDDPSFQDDLPPGRQPQFDNPRAPPPAFDAPIDPKRPGTPTGRVPFDPTRPGTPTGRVPFEPKRPGTGATTPKKPPSLLDERPFSSQGLPPGRNDPQNSGFPPQGPGFDDFGRPPMDEFGRPMDDFDSNDDFNNLDPNGFDDFGRGAPPRNANIDSSRFPMRSGNGRF